MKKLKILLGDPRHGIDNAHSPYVPIGIGYIGSYLKKKFEGQVNIELELSTNPQEIFDLLDNWKPDIIGISNYVWNASLSNFICDYAKKKNSSTLCILGGPEFPAGTGARDIKNTTEDQTYDKSFKYLINRPSVDFFAWSDGEVAIIELVRKFIDNNSSIESMKSEDKPMKGCTYISKDKKKLIVGKYISRIGMDGSIKAHGRDIIPSPYTTGLLDKFLNGKFVPSFETARGCPFLCTFCDQGLDVSKIASHSNLRMFNELKYVAERVCKTESSIKHISFFDSNWGMYEKDVEFAEYIFRVMEKYDWPEYIMARAPKSNRDNILKINDRLKNRVRFGLSMQSLNIETLTDIKRRNWTMNEYLNFLDELRKRGKTATSEMIIPLPGETEQSYFEGQKFLMDNSIVPETYTLMMLCGAELGRDQAIKKYNMKSKFRILPKEYGNYEGTKLFEIEQICVQTNTMNYQNYLKCRNYSLFVKLLNHKLFLPIHKLTKKLNISWYELTRALIDFIEDKNFEGKLKDYYNEFCSESRDELFDTEEEAISFYYDQKNYKRLEKGEIGENLSKKYLAKGLFIYSEVISTIFYLIKNKLMKDHNEENILIINSSEKWLKNSHMINEIFGENNFKKDNNFELIIDFDFPGWLAKSHLPLSQFKENSTYKLYYDSQKINTLRDRLKSRFGPMSQRTFATYLSQTKDGFDNIHKQFKKVI